MHGSPLSKYNNRDLWTHYDYHSYKIRGEAFLSFEQNNDDIHYLTDTGRTWSDKHTLRDVMKTTSGHDDTGISGHALTISSNGCETPREKTLPYRSSRAVVSQSR